MATKKMAPAKKPAAPPKPEGDAPKLAPATLALARKLQRDLPSVAVREGVSFTPEQDILLAHGWPYLRVIVDDHPDDASAAKQAQDALTDADTYHVEWPRKVAEIYCRAIGLREEEDLGAEEDAKRAAKMKGAVTADEGKQWITNSLSFPGSSLNDRHVASFLFLTEAMIGTAATLDALAAGLGAAGKGQSSIEAGHAALFAGFLLRRAPAGVADKQRARLAKLHQSLRAAGRNDNFLDTLGIVLGGAKVAKAIALNPYYWIDVTDDPAAVRESLEAGGWTPTIRNVYLAGVDSIDLVAGSWRKNFKYEDEQAWFLEQLTWLRSPKARKIIEDMAGTSRVKTRAKAWLSANPK